MTQQQQQQQEPAKFEDARRRFTLKSLKFTRGLEGEGFTCTLYVDGVKAATCEDWATGGPVSIHDIDAAKMTEFRAFAAAMPAECYYGMMMVIQDETLINRLVDYELTLRKVRRGLKRGDLYIDKTGTPGSYYSINAGIFSDATRAKRFLSKHPEAIHPIHASSPDADVFAFVDAMMMALANAPDENCE